MVRDLYRIVDHAPGMSHPLATDHELILRIVAEWVAQATMPSGNADTPTNSIQQALLLFTRNGTHRPDLYDQIDARH